MPPDERLSADDVAKPTKVAYRPDAKYPWLIAQGHNEVKLTERQAMEVIQALLGARNDGGDHA